MASRDDNKKDNPSAQQALQDYLDQMLGVTAVTLSAPSLSAIEISQPVEKKAPQLPEQLPAPTTSSLPNNVSATPSAAHLSAKPAALADATDTLATDTLQQKLVQARVKDLAEKSLHNARAQAEQSAQSAAAADMQRRERLAAARELVKQRIAARAVASQPSDEPVPALEVPAEALQGGVADAAAEAEAEAEVVHEPAPALQLAEVPQWLENGRPVWAQSAFECLLFSVSGLTLAVPLIELGSIYPLREHLSPIVGQVDWFIGLMHVDGRKHLRTVNTAKIVMPEKYDPAFVDQIRYVISINGHDWGLAVDKIDKAVTLLPDDVRWRHERSRRPWLAGTVVEYMCALVDVQELALMLSRADHGRPQLRH